jgi:aspartate/methionine/tyrosine aminotransferase
MPSYYSTAVAMAAYELGYERVTRSIVEPTNASRRVLKDFLVEHNFEHILGQGYYAFINVGRWLQAKGWKDSEALGQYLAEQHGVAIVPGIYFSADGAEWIRFSYATPVELTLGAAQRLVDGLSALVN